MAKRRTTDDKLMQKAREMMEAGVDYKTFHNTFFGPDSELLAGKSREERALLVQSPIYKQLKDMALDLGVALPSDQSPRAA